MKVRIGLSSTDGVQECREVVQVEPLISCAGVEGDDVGCSCRACDRIGRGLRASGFRRDIWIPVRTTAQESHHVAVDAGLSKVNVSKQGRASQASPRKGPIQRGSVCTQLGSESPAGAGTLGEHFIESGQFRGSAKRPLIIAVVSTHALARDGGHCEHTDCRRCDIKSKILHVSFSKSLEYPGSLYPQVALVNRIWSENVTTHYLFHLVFTNPLPRASQDSRTDLGFRF